MPKPPEAFPDIDYSAVGLVIPKDPSPEILAAGWNSSAWQVGNQVVKITSKAASIAKTEDLLVTMLREHDVLEDYLGEYMTTTDYCLVPHHNGDQARIVTIQPFIQGTHLPEYLSNLHNPTDPLRDFLAKSKQVFKDRRLMPDIACIEDGFNVLSNSNILIREDQDAKPELVDTTFGKTQRSAKLGPLWTRLIYAGAIAADTRLRLERAS